MEYDVYVASSGLIKAGKEAEICFQPNKTEKENKKQREKKNKKKKERKRVIRATESKREVPLQPMKS